MLEKNGHDSGDFWNLRHDNSVFVKFPEKSLISSWKNNVINEKITCYCIRTIKLNYLCMVENSWKLKYSQQSQDSVVQFIFHCIFCFYECIFKSSKTCKFSIKFSQFSKEKIKTVTQFQVPLRKKNFTRQDVNNEIIINFQYSSFFLWEYFNRKFMKAHVERIQQISNRKLFFNVASKIVEKRERTC